MESLEPLVASGRVQISLWEVDLSVAAIHNAGNQRQWSKPMEVARPRQAVALIGDLT